MLHLNIATNEPQIISVQHPYNQQHSAHLCTPVCLHIPHGEVSIFTLFLFISAFVCFVSCRIVDLVRHFKQSERDVCSVVCFWNVASLNFGKY